MSWTFLILKSTRCFILLNGTKEKRWNNSVSPISSKWIHMRDRGFAFLGASELRACEGPTYRGCEITQSWTANLVVGCRALCWMTVLVSAERRGKHTEHTTHLCWLNHLNISLKCTEITQSHSLDQDSDHFLNSIRVERCMHIWCQENSLCYSVPGVGKATVLWL